MEHHLAPSCRQLLIFAAACAHDRRVQSFSMAILRDAMNALFAEGEIKVETYGPPSRQVSRIVRDKSCLIGPWRGKATLMSKGPGRVERAIEALFKSKPNDAFATWELCWRVYPNIARLERTHKVAVTRAAKKVCARLSDWQSTRTWYRGGELVFFNHASVKSYGLARRMSDSRHLNDKQIRASLKRGGDHHGYVVEGGTWWRHVQLYIADRDGDTSERAMALRRKENEVMASYGLPPKTPLHPRKLNV